MSLLLVKQRISISEPQMEGGLRVTYAISLELAEKHAVDFL